ncbi:SLAM family member 6 isoform X2 [Equus przewalskii]|uniref:SLAM family member 6 isoform X2 n=1 Tax=Equus przewalskii TaxID=9798 RepID=A0ABM2F1D0_EQUPR|nr:SLAM family member 6 isoform X2 [Equus caballus]XP_008518684.1 PREDICTED: SLAM family member 6 isoform X3 [Equus przewalskii]
MAKTARMLPALRSPAPVPTPESMIQLFQFLTLVFCLGPGNTVSQTSSAPLMVDGFLGESVTLPLKLPAGEKIYSITWLHNGTSIVFIDPNDARILVTARKRKDALNVTQSYSLQLSNLTMADTGFYKAQIGTENSSVFSCYTLRIFRRLRNLQVANHSQLSVNGTCEIHLTCTAENPNDNILLKWQISGNTSLNEANITISWDPKTSNEETYTCIAQNPISNLSFSVSAQSLCKGVFNQKNQPLDIKWIITITIIIIGVLLACIFIYVWGKKTGSFCSCTQQGQSPAETRRNLDYDSVSPGHTVYAQVATHPTRERNIPTPAENSESTTVYSTVQQHNEIFNHHPVSSHDHL